MRAGRLPIATLLALEAQAHRWPARTVREVLGGYLVHDPSDHEPIFNRLVDPELPTLDGGRGGALGGRGGALVVPGGGRDGGWDTWLGNVRRAFDDISRRPHLWLTAAPDDPRIARLERDGFGQVGASRYMYLRDRAASEATATSAAAAAAEVELERVDVTTADRVRAARDVAAVIADAFELDKAFHVLIEADVVQMLEVPAIGFVLVRLDGEPVAVARRTTERRASLLAAIGTRRDFRGRGFGRLVTWAATRDALAVGSDIVFLGVEDGNDAARHLYEQLGYAFAEGGVVALLQR
ncbi:MAG: GNAT family N-acetyltransferase [Chloroflexi bacterium]|nr:GNAT family N-acetyltransferase [Chloroflexota bacterium]